MFKINIDGMDYRVTFSHPEPIYIRDKNGNPKMDGLRKDPYQLPSGKDVWRLLTTCIIERDGLVFSVGQTAFNPKDRRYDHRIGRRWSLKYALEGAGFPKPMRELFWTKYKQLLGLPA